MVRRIHIIRHGDRWDVLDPTFIEQSAWPHDSPLSPLGEQQSQEVAQRLLLLSKASKEPIKHVLTSPYLRCVQTARPMCQQLDTSIKIEAGLSEMYHNTEIATPRERFQYYPRVDLEYESLIFPRNPERDVANRVYRAIRALLHRFRDEEQLVLVTHAGICVLLAAFLMEGLPETVSNETMARVAAASPCCIFTLDINDPTDGAARARVPPSSGGLSTEYYRETWTLTVNGDTSHLTSPFGPTRPWHQFESVLFARQFGTVAKYNPQAGDEKPVVVWVDRTPETATAFFHSLTARHSNIQPYVFVNSNEAGSCVLNLGSRVRCVVTNIRRTRWDSGLLFMAALRRGGYTGAIIVESDTARKSKKVRNSCFPDANHIVVGGAEELERIILYCCGMLH